MKATLEYTLPEDRYALDTALAAETWQENMRAFDCWMRSVEKHGRVNECPAGVPHDAWQAAVMAVRAVFWKYVKDAGGFTEDA